MSTRIYESGYSKLQNGTVDKFIKSKQKEQ